MAAKPRPYSVAFRQNITIECRSSARKRAVPSIRVYPCPSVAKSPVSFRVRSAFAGWFWATDGHGSPRSRIATRPNRRRQLSQILDILAQRVAIHGDIHLPGHEMEAHAQPLFGLLEIARLNRRKLAVAVGHVHHLS